MNNRRRKVLSVVAAFAMSGTALQFTDCSADVSNLVIDAANSATQLLAGAAIDALFLSFGDPTLLGT